MTERELIEKVVDYTLEGVAHLFDKDGDYHIGPIYKWDGSEGYCRVSVHEEFELDSEDERALLKSYHNVAKQTQDTILQRVRDILEGKGSKGLEPFELKNYPKDAKEFAWRQHDLYKWGELKGLTGTDEREWEETNRFLDGES